MRVRPAHNRFNYSRVARTARGADSFSFFLVVKDQTLVHEDNPLIPIIIHLAFVLRCVKSALRELHEREDFSSTELSDWLTPSLTHSLTEWAPCLVQTWEHVCHAPPWKKESVGYIDLMHFSTVFDSSRRGAPICKQIEDGSPLYCIFRILKNWWQSARTNVKLDNFGCR